MPKDAKSRTSPYSAVNPSAMINRACEPRSGSHAKRWGRFASETVCLRENVNHLAFRGDLVLNLAGQLIDDGASAHALNLQGH